MQDLKNDIDHYGLEAAIDHYGLARVLEVISEIASEKAEHIAVNWQDNKTAVQWQRCAAAIDTAAAVARARLG